MLTNVVAIIVIALLSRQQPERGVIFAQLYLLAVYGLLRFPIPIPVC